MRRFSRRRSIRGSRSTRTGRRQISKREAIFTQLANKAAQGDPRAIQTVLRESEKLDRHNEKVAEEAQARPIGAVIILPDNGRDPSIARRKL